MNEEIRNLKDKINDIKESATFSNDEQLKEKISKVYDILEKTKEQEVNVETVEIVLNVQQLMEDLENDGS